MHGFTTKTMCMIFARHTNMPMCVCVLVCCLCILNVVHDVMAMMISAFYACDCNNVVLSCAQEGGNADAIVLHVMLHSV